MLAAECVYEFERLGQFLALIRKGAMGIPFAFNCFHVRLLWGILSPNSVCFPVSNLCYRSGWILV
jgi:hypothetical protein